MTKAAFYATRPEPPPVNNGGASVTESLIRRLTSYGYEKVAPGLSADLEARNQIGIETYGDELRFDNGRDSLIDWYQEALDSSKYGDLSVGVYGNKPTSAFEREIFHIYVTQLDITARLKRLLQKRYEE
jgi:hypothetical protein